MIDSLGGDLKQEEWLLRWRQHIVQWPLKALKERMYSSVFSVTGKPARWVLRDNGI